MKALPARPAFTGMRHTAFLLAALLAFGWQSLVTQTHVHPAGPTAAFAAITGKFSPSYASGEPRGKASGRPADCPLCYELALSGVYLASAPMAFTPPVLPAWWQAATPALGTSLQLRSHSWQSRAPPFSIRT